MHATQILEQRQTASNIIDLWQQLTLAQKYAVSELQRYGYQLQFVRHSASSKVAIMDLAGKLATITEDGQIDTEPYLLLRH